MKGTIIVYWHLHTPLSKNFPNNPSPLNKIPLTPKKSQQLKAFYKSEGHPPSQPILGLLPRKWLGLGLRL